MPSEQWYEQCRQAGFLLRSDSPALAKNYGMPGTEGLDPPPWFDINGEQIEYIGACPEVKSEQTIVPPAMPSGLEAIQE